MQNYQISLQTFLHAEFSCLVGIFLMERGCLVLGVFLVGFGFL